MVPVTLGILVGGCAGIEKNYKVQGKLVAEEWMALRDIENLLENRTVFSMVRPSAEGPWVYAALLKSAEECEWARERLLASSLVLTAEPCAEFFGTPHRVDYV